MTLISQSFAILVVAALSIAEGTDVVAQSILKVSEGETYTVTDTEDQMLVDMWVMEDNSKIVFEEGITSWNIHAKEAHFGKNVRIIGVGSDGNNGNAGGRGHNAGECRDGGHAANGGRGDDGETGINVTLTIGLVRVDDLVIDVRGGNGGDGGKGGKGGKGGRASCGRICSGQEGGNGGNGGDAGYGGNGGHVTVHYWVADQDAVSVGLQSDASGAGLRVNNEGGQAGRPGGAGGGGRGGDGKECSGGLYRHGGGPWGKNGQGGHAGRPGKQGEITFRALPSP